jgi:ADP-dependent NAD(P)H-hydrate dehydratase
MTEPLPKLPPRPVDGHKGTFGTVCVLGGQAAGPRVMIGGPAFSATAALRVGCGLAVLAVPRPIMASALVIAPSATGLALPVDGERMLDPSAVAALLDAYMAGFHCLAIGPGLGDAEPQQQILMRLLGNGDVPMVIDADGLNTLAAVPEFQRDFRATAVLTPHPGEFRRLASAVGIDADPVDPDRRVAAASQLASRLGCIVVLKGAGTVISDGINVHVNTTGNVALATAGTGDVLTGIIAGLIAQHFKPNLGVGSRQVTAEQQGGLSLYDCARLGVHLHGLAADLWRAEHLDVGLTAADLVDLIPAALKVMRDGSS